MRKARKNFTQLVLSGHWFDEIKSGKKTHEYREVKPYWIKRLNHLKEQAEMAMVFGNRMYYPPCVILQRGYVKDAPVMLFYIERIKVLPTGINTDLNVPGPVYDIELGPQVYETKWIYYEKGHKELDFSKRVVRAPEYRMGKWIEFKGAEYERVEK